MEGGGVGDQHQASVFLVHGRRADPAHIRRGNDKRRRGEMLQIGKNGHAHTTSTDGLWYHFCASLTRFFYSCATTPPMNSLSGLIIKKLQRLRSPLHLGVVKSSSLPYVWD